MKRHILAVNRFPLRGVTSAWKIEAVFLRGSSVSGEEPVLGSGPINSAPLAPKPQNIRGLSYAANNGLFANGSRR